MTTAIIIIICLLVLLGYIFDITASRTRIPTVIILLALGWGLQQGVTFFGIRIPDLNPVMPSLGTIGLILIVLDGVLELELKRDRMALIGKAALTAIIPMLSMSMLMAVILLACNKTPLADGMLNSIPLAVISSAIAIPTARQLNSHFREFIVYESSLSDILGILLFNFFAVNQLVTGHSLLTFLSQLAIMLMLSVTATFGLAWLLSHTRQKIRFMPLILMVILIYSISKLYHLPGLLFIMVLGLFLGNLGIFPQNRLIRYLRPGSLAVEVDKFRELTAEVTFLVRSLFFILFGFLMKTEDIINISSLPWSLGIVMLILATRALQLRLSRLPLKPLLFIAPRGLITILLFLSIPLSRSIPVINSSVIIQVIVMSSLIMAAGSFATEGKQNVAPENESNT